MGIGSMWSNFPQPRFRCVAPALVVRDRGHLVSCPISQPVAKSESILAIKASQEAYVVDSLTVRRSFIFALALGLAAVGPVSFCECAPLSSKLPECATSKTQSRCNHMNMDESGTRLVAASDRSCCNVSKAPIPQSQYKESDFSMAAPAAALDATAEVPRSQPFLPAQIVQDLSPPPLRSLLCTFLI